VGLRALKAGRLGPLLVGKTIGFEISSGMGGRRKPQLRAARWPGVHDRCRAELPPVVPSLIVQDSWRIGVGLHTLAFWSPGRALGAPIQPGSRRRVRATAHGRGHDAGRGFPLHPLRFATGHLICGNDAGTATVTLGSESFAALVCLPIEPHDGDHKSTGSYLQHGFSFTRGPACAWSGQKLSKLAYPGRRLFVGGP